MSSSIEPTRAPSRRQRCLAALVPAAALLVASGCNIVAPVMLFAAGPEKTKALYELPTNRPAVVFVDDRSNVLPSRAIRQRIAKAAEQTLLEADAVKESEIISSDAVAAVSSSERFSRPKSIADIGSAVGAEVVVYATIDSFSLSPDGQQFGPTASLRVKVVDSPAKERLWPKQPEEWHVVSLSLPVRTGDIPKSQAERIRAEQDFADRVGRAIGHVFVKHEARPKSELIGTTS